MARDPRAGSLCPGHRTGGPGRKGRCGMFGQIKASRAAIGLAEPIKAGHATTIDASTRTGRRRPRPGARRVLGMVLAALMCGAMAATGASAATYNGPFGTQVEIGTATCWWHNDYVWATSLSDSGTRLSKDLVLEGPAVHMGPPSSFGKFTNVKWTVSWYSLTNGAKQWVRENDIVSWGTHTAVFSTTWTFGSPIISVKPAFSGRIIVYERLDYTDAQGRTVAGGSFDYVEPAYITHIYSYSPSHDESTNGFCVL